MVVVMVFGLASFMGALAAAAYRLAGVVFKRQLAKQRSRPSAGLDMLPTYVSLAVMFFAKDVLSGPLKALAEHKPFAEGLTWILTCLRTGHTRLVEPRSARKPPTAVPR